MDQGPYAGRASEPGCALLITDGGPGTSEELGQHVDSINKI